MWCRGAVSMALAGMVMCAACARRYVPHKALSSVVCARILRGQIDMMALLRPDDFARLDCVGRPRRLDRPARRLVGFKNWEDGADECSSDAWGRDWVVFCSAGEVYVMSAGEDGLLGTSDDVLAPRPAPSPSTASVPAVPSR